MVQENTTFYRLGYPAVAWLGYGVSAFLGVISLGLLVYTRKRKNREESGTQATGTH